MPPASDELAHRGVDLEAPQRAEERSRLMGLVDDDAVLGAPPDLERDVGGRDPLGELQRAARHVQPWVLGRRPADLARKVPLEERSVRPAEAAEAPRATLDLGHLPLAA